MDGWFIDPTLSWQLVPLEARNKKPRNKRLAVWNPETFWQIGPKRRFSIPIPSDAPTSRWTSWIHRSGQVLGQRLRSSRFQRKHQTSWRTRDKQHFPANWPLQSVESGGYKNGSNIIWIHNGILQFHIPQTVLNLCRQFARANGVFQNFQWFRALNGLSLTHAGKFQTSRIYLSPGTLFAVHYNQKLFRLEGKNHPIEQEAIIFRLHVLGCQPLTFHQPFKQFLPGWHQKRFPWEFMDPHYKNRT